MGIIISYPLCMKCSLESRVYYLEIFYIDKCSLESRVYYLEIFYIDKCSLESRVYYLEIFCRQIFIQSKKNKNAVLLFHHEINDIHVCDNILNS